MRKDILIRLNKLVLGVSVAVAFASTALGQQPVKLSQMQRENAELLRHYTWKSRSDIRKGGETKLVRLDQIRYAVDGSLQTTQLSLEAAELPSGGLRGMIAKKKKGEFTELVEGLKGLATSYGQLAPEKLQRFVESASITADQKVSGRLVRLTGSDVLSAGDSMTIWIDPIERKQKRVEVTTSFGGSRVRIVSEFRELPGGPVYLARAAIEYPDKQLVITTENFDHVRQNEGGIGSK